MEASPSTPILSGKTGQLSTDSFSPDTDQKVDNGSAQRSDSAENVQQTSASLLAQVLQALQDGGPHPTRDQLEKVAEACDAWQNYAVAHGDSRPDAGALINDFIHTFYNNESNPGAEAVYSFQQGEPAGSDAAVIIAGALIAVSNIPANAQFLKVEPPSGEFGSGDFGTEMHSEIAKALKAKFPNVRFDFRVEPGQTGVDVTVLDEHDVPTVGFEHAEIKPNTASGQRTFNDQVQRWKDSGKLPQDAQVPPLAYDADGTIHLGFKLNQTKK